MGVDASTIACLVLKLWLKSIDSQRRAMSLIRFPVWMFTLAIGLTTMTNGYGQEFPRKPIRILTGTAASASDFASRIIAQALTANWGQQVIVDNRAVIVA